MRRRPAMLHYLETLTLTLGAIGTALGGIYAILRFIGHELVIPFREKLFARADSFFNRLDDTMAKLGSHIESINHNLTEQTASLKRLEAQHAPKPEPTDNRLLALLLAVLFATPAMAQAPS